MARREGLSVAGRSGFGNIRKLPSGRYQARYTNVVGATTNAPVTFDTKGDAKTWLATVQSDLARGAWLPPNADITLRSYADTWLDHRSIKPRTRVHYRKLLDHHILPTLGSIPMRRLSPATVREWHARAALGSPTIRAHAYGLLKTICGTAVADDLVIANPCRIRGASQAKRASRTEPATLEQLAAAVEAMPRRYKLMVLLAAWCALRFGELTELRGHDIDTRAGIVKVRRGVSWVDGLPIVGDPKSDAGTRDVDIPPHLLPAIRAHLLEFGVGRDGLLFPAARDAKAHMAPATLYRVWYRARDLAGRPDLRFHDLRHTGATLAAATGATLAELMERLGHSTPAAALRYQHSAKHRGAEIAAKLSEIAGSQ
jgi:integrase